MTIDPKYINEVISLQLDYANLIKEFLQISKIQVGKKDDIINELKNHYSSVIKSTRTSDYICNFEGLLRILEKRNELSYSNIDPLIYIQSSYLQDHALSTLLFDYDQRLRKCLPLPLLNFYNLPNVLLSEDQVRNSEICSNDKGFWQLPFRNKMIIHDTTQSGFDFNASGYDRISAEKKIFHKDDAELARKVFLEVSSKLGRKWRDLARLLGVTESNIDEIENHSHLSLNEKAFKTFEKFYSTSDSSQWKSRLRQALEKVRRRDLLEMVEELLLAECT